MGEIGSIAFGEWLLNSGYTSIKVYNRKSREYFYMWGVVPSDFIYFTTKELLDQFKQTQKDG